MARRFRVSFRRNVNIPRVITKVVATGIGLYVGNEVVTQLGTIMNGTTGAFNTGFKLIGWAVGTGGSPACASATEICQTTGSGVLAVIGIVGFASVILEFVRFNL